MSNSTTTAAKKYPFSRDSGDRWLGQMPEHWKVIRLRNILKSKAERDRPDLPLLSVVREKGVILRDSEDSEENHNVIPEDLSNYKVVREGQFAMNKMKAWQGSYGVSPYEGIVSPALLHLQRYGNRRELPPLSVAKPRLRQVFSHKRQTESESVNGTSPPQE